MIQISSKIPQQLGKTWKPEAKTIFRVWYIETIRLVRIATVTKQWKNLNYFWTFLEVLDLLGCFGAFQDVLVRFCMFWYVLEFLFKTCCLLKMFFLVKMCFLVKTFFCCKNMTFGENLFLVKKWFLVKTCLWWKLFF